MSVGKRDYLSRLQPLLIFLILNDIVKMKLAILPFLCCGGKQCYEIAFLSNLMLIDMIQETSTNVGLR